MLARRFLWIITGIVVLTLAAALGYRMFGAQIMRAAMVPPISFKQSPQDAAPDYTRPAMWLARPGLERDPSRWAPPGYAAAPHPDVAVFYVAPTTYLLRDRWNAPLQDRDADMRSILFTQTQASVFNGIGGVWAPRYRQATFGAFLTDSADARASLDLAYGDVLAAFDLFLRSIPADRPIIIAGHSQGALHATRLLKDRVAGTPLARRIVAVYLGGWPVSTTADLPAMGLPACTGAAQPGCVLAWQSFAEPADPSIILDAYNASTGLTGAPRRGTPMLCVNPITGAPASAAAASANLGSLEPGADFLSLAVVPGKVGARCENGLLLVGNPPPAFGRYVLPGNNFHVYDYALFWANLRADAEKRAAAFAARR